MNCNHDDFTLATITGRIISPDAAHIMTNDVKVSLKIKK